MAPVPNPRDGRRRSSIDYRSIGIHVDDGEDEVARSKTKSRFLSVNNEADETSVDSVYVEDGRQHQRTSASELGGFVNIHKKVRDDVFYALGTTKQGLSSAEARARAAEFGPNEMPRVHANVGWLRRFFAQFLDPFAILLAVSAIFDLIIYLTVEHETNVLIMSVAIMVVVVLNASIGVLQEYSASRAAKALVALLPHRTIALRDGHRVSLAASELVPGDVVILEEGDAISADARVVESTGLTVNNLALTGESQPIVRTDDPADPDALLADAPNIVFMGTVVAGGRGIAVVFATGRNTCIGGVFATTANIPDRPSPLQRKIKTMAKAVFAIAAILGVAQFVLGIGLNRGAHAMSSLILAVGVMVALVPEGMPATLSVSLAVAGRRLARRMMIVKRLTTVETLGSANVFCVDKTGTITTAEMTVVNVWASGRDHRVIGVGYEPVGVVENAPGVHETLTTAALCSNAIMCPPVAGTSIGWRCLGDTMEGAILVAAEKAGIDIAAVRCMKPRLRENPFDPTRKLMSTVHGRAAAGAGASAGKLETGVDLMAKGTPETVLARCAAVLWDGTVVPLTTELRLRILHATDAMAMNGLRVLAVARRAVESDAWKAVSASQLECRLTLCGLLGIMDPPRDDARGAMRTLVRAGLRPVMLTGDYGLTAFAIARQVGIVGQTGNADCVVTGDELDAMDNAALSLALAVTPEHGLRPLIFARTKPEHKMRVVAALQNMGNIVAVTGDGINDAPALRMADVGVAMGSGTDVAKESAVVILTDDSLATLPAAVEIGRSVADNLRRMLMYIFTHNVSELVPSLAAAAAGMRLPALNALQVLAIDLGSDVLPALALGTERPERDVLDRSPVSPNERLFSMTSFMRLAFLGAIQSAAVVNLFFLHMMDYEGSFSRVEASDPVYQRAATAAQAAIVVVQFFNAHSVRSDLDSVLTVGLLSNRFLLAAETLGLCIMCAISYIPYLQTAFSTVALSGLDWGICFGWGVFSLVAEELRKAYMRYRRRRETANAIMSGMRTGLLTGAPSSRYS